MAWLMSEARVLASIDVAESFGQRFRGLVGRDSIDGAYAIPHCRWVHSFGMRFPLDIAFVGNDNVVIKISTLHRNRLSMPVPKARMVIEAKAGAFERWGLVVGDKLEIRSTNPNPVP